MKSCKDCLHLEVCTSIDGDMIYTDQDVKELVLSGDVRNLCCDFTDRSEWVKMKHGKWDDSFDGITPVCSVCGRTHSCFRRSPDYCPNCGAKMDGDAE